MKNQNKTQKAIRLLLITILIAVSALFIYFTAISSQITSTEKTITIIMSALSAISTIILIFITMSNRKAPLAAIFLLTLIAPSCSSQKEFTRHEERLIERTEYEEEANVIRVSILKIGEETLVIMTSGNSTLGVYTKALPGEGLMAVWRRAKAIYPGRTYNQMLKLNPSVEPSRLKLDQLIRIR